MLMNCAAVSVSMVAGAVMLVEGLGWSDGLNLAAHRLDGGVRRLSGVDFFQHATDGVQVVELVGKGANGGGVADIHLRE